MRIRWRVAGAIALVTMCFSLFLTAYVYSYSMKREKRRFEEDYATKLQIVEATLSQLEQAADLIAHNALIAWRLRVDKVGLESDAELTDLARNLHVAHLFATNADGRFVRSTNGPVELYEHGIFDYCDGYRGLLSGTTEIEQTPMVPSMDEAMPGPFKYTMMPNHDRSGVLEASMSLDFVRRTLAAAYDADPDLHGLILYAENGTLLGHIGRSVGGNVEDPVQLACLTESPQWRGHELILGRRLLTTKANCCECGLKNLAGEDGQFSYFIVAHVSTEGFGHFRERLGRDLASMFFLLSSLGGVVAWFLSRYLVTRLEEIANRLNLIVASEDLGTGLPIRGTDEVATVAKGINAMMERLRTAVERQLVLENLKVIAQTARQVAHDIRSPLTAITMAARDLGMLPEETRHLMRSAIHRIQDIANDLLERPTDESSGGQKHEAFDAIPIFSVLESIVSEKRTQYRAHLAIEIEYRPLSADYGIFVEFPSSKLRRIVSNLVSNSVEAILPSGGTVLVTVELADDQAKVIVSDTGKGIPPDVLQRLGAEEITHGKKEGYGLGVHEARAFLGQHGGSLHFDSTVGLGTRVEIGLRRGRCPSWFLERLIIGREAVVVVVDDDSSIHAIWDERLLGSGVQAEQIVHMAMPTELREFLKGRFDVDCMVFLVDYEFLGDVTNGHSLISELKIEDNSILVTSRFCEPEIQHLCMDSGVKLVPKAAAAHIPIERAGSSFRGRHHG